MRHQTNHYLDARQVIDFLQDYDVYRNPNGVEISYNSNRSVMIAVPWPGSSRDPYFDMEICINALPFEDFTRLFKISSVSDLNSIKPIVLTHLFEIGAAEVSCIIIQDADCYCMQYRKLGNGIIAIDDYDEEHFVCKNLHTYEDYKEYSLRYYEKSLYH